MEESNFWTNREAPSEMIMTKKEAIEMMLKGYIVAMEGSSADLWYDDSIGVFEFVNSEEYSPFNINDLSNELNYVVVKKK